MSLENIHFSNFGGPHRVSFLRILIKKGNPTIVCVTVMTLVSNGVY